MKKYFRIAGYTFLALCGLYAWMTIQTGWRHYVGFAFFFLSSLRIFSLILPKADSREHDKR